VGKRAMQRTTYNTNHDKIIIILEIKSVCHGNAKKRTVMTMSIENIFMKKVGYVWSKVDFYISVADKWRD